MKNLFFSALVVLLSAASVHAANSSKYVPPTCTLSFDNFKDATKSKKVSIPVFVGNDNIMTTEIEDNEGLTYQVTANAFQEDTSFMLIKILAHESTGSILTDVHFIGNMAQLVYKIDMVHTATMTCYK